MFVTLLSVGVTIYILVRFEILTGPDNTVPSPARIIFIFVLAALLAGFVMTFFFGMIPLKPINYLINQMNRLAAGDYRARIKYFKLLGKHPTMIEFTDSFNRMAEELQNTEMLRSDFINNFSHEFKTPIVSIAGFAKLLRKANLSEDQKEEYLRIIEEESLRLSQMATNVLNMTEVENKTILTDVTEYNLSEQIRSCILLLSEKWEEKELNFDLGFDEYMIHANEELMKQVWINLLDNAIKFTPDKGSIEVKIKENDDSFEISVMNTGSQIAPEHYKRIFNKFYQTDESHATEGNGIGLAIVKRVIDLHEGSVEVSSENNETTFTVFLPKK